MDITTAIVLLLLLLAVRVKASPFGGKVQQLAAAIAKAEGFYASNPLNIPRSHHNPGNITDDAGWVIAYATDDDGWAALYHQVDLMLSGASRVYSPDMTFAEVALIYTGNDNPGAWASIVTGQLGLSPVNTLRDFTEG